MTWVDGTGSDALIPTYQAVPGLYLAWMTLSFFLLSAAAHAFIVFTNFRQALALDEGAVVCCVRSTRDVGFFSGWYYIWIHECRMPHRWIEYSFSASIMAMVFAVAGGINHLYMVIFIFALMWCTMVFGHFAEVVNRPEPAESPDKKPLYWMMRQQNPQLLAFPHLLVFPMFDAMSARLHRLAPHFMGWIPYLTVWVVLLHSFLYNLDDSQSQGRSPPDFVYAIIIGQAVTFSFFCFTQLFLLSRVDGPELYFWGEMSYQVLSLVAKGLLGSILLANVLLYDSFEAAVAAAD